MIDPNEAPEGFVAVAPPSHGWACKQCCLYADDATCIKSPCRGSVRKDGESVIFIPREKSNLAEPSNVVDFAEAKAQIEQLPKSNLAEFSAIGELAEEKALHEITKAANIRFAEDLIKAKDESLASKHAVNNLTIELADLIKKNEALEKKVFNQRVQIKYFESSTNLAAKNPLSKAKEEAARWKSSHDHVCRELASCENARDENARLCEEARDEASRWKAQCRDLTSLVANLRAQLTTALESIARMR